MCHVLIIEDDWIIADHVVQLVERAGALSVEVATSEEEAVARAFDRFPDVIISDVSLSGGSGPAAVARITAKLGNTPVMFVTGEPQGFRPPAPDMLVLHKPVEDRTLIATFKTIAPIMLVIEEHRYIDRP
jgi:two-component system, response regulator PdtaR